MTDVYSTTPLARVARIGQDRNEQPSHNFVILDCTEPERAGEKILVDDLVPIAVFREKAALVVGPGLLERDIHAEIYSTPIRPEDAVPATNRRLSTRLERSANTTASPSADTTLPRP